MRLPRKDSAGMWILLNSKWLWLFWYPKGSWWLGHIKNPDWDWNYWVVDAWRLRISFPVGHRFFEWEIP